MSDSLQVPEVPEAQPEDPEDVSWALSTAEAMWARGDHSEGIKWVRRAAEAASEAEKDERALELAKAAAELAGMISRGVSRGSIDLEEVVEAAPPPVPPARMSALPHPVSKPPAAPAKPASVAPKALTSPSRAPAPLPSQSQPPPAVTPVAPAVAARGVAAPRPGAAQPAPSKAKAAIATPVNPMKPPASVRGTGSKRARKSRENLENEAKEAKALARAGDTLRHPALDSSGAPVAPAPPSSDTLVTNNDATIIGNMSDLLKHDKPSASMKAAQAASNGTLATRASKAPPAPAAEKPAASVGPRSVPPHSSRAAAATQQHDPNIVTSQAVRVVVWRDAGGIRVAPAGTVVSAITIDAVLVALEPNADLTAWLGSPDRT